MTNPLSTDDDGEEPERTEEARSLARSLGRRYKRREGGSGREGALARESAVDLEAAVGRGRQSRNW